jgi:predicted Zn finger-like uncharacterized protein
LKFLCDNCKAKYQIADEKVAGKTVRMKCRKCGHQIEVRAAVTETSVASQPPPPPGPRAGIRPGGLATSLSATKPRAPSQPFSSGGALAGAFKSQVADSPSSLRPSDVPTASEIGAISVTDEWYVAINGVPVGPVRISELRRKAAAGAVNEDSLCWQEGLEEWRPIRAIPELAALVREAMLGNRASLVAPEPIAPRVSAPPRPATPVPPAPARPSTERPSPVRPAPPARSNVVPFHGRGPSVPSPASGAIDVELAPVTAPLGGNAAAARAPSPFSVTPAPKMVPQPTPDPFTFNPVVPTPAPPAPAQAAPPAMASGTYDPFAIGAPQMSTTPPAPMIAPLSTSPSIPPGYMPVDQGRRGVPLWFWPILLLALGFGGMVAFLVFRQPAPQPVVIQMPATANAPPTTTSEVPPPPASNEVTPAPPDSATPTKKPTGGTRVATPTPTSTQRAADLSGLVGGSSGGSGPVVGGSSGGAQPSGGSFDQAAVERVVANHRAGVKRTCWERNSGPDQKSSVNVTVNATVAPNGTVSSTSSNGDDPVVAKCIESQVKTWTFPAPGESKQIALPFKFVRQ